MATLALVEQLIQLLTLEVVECVHWRVGALLYMYCHTVRGKPERVEKEWNVLLKVCTLYTIGDKTFLLFVGLKHREVFYGLISFCIFNSVFLTPSFHLFATSLLASLVNSVPTS